MQQQRSISAIAQDIRADWSNPYFGAIPYLQAMASLRGPSDNYGEDDAKSIVAYFLSNARNYRGPRAKELKAELRQVCNIK